MNKLYIVYGVVVGIVVAVLVGFGIYNLVVLQQTVARDDATLSQVVGFINQGIQASQKATPTTK